MNDFIKEIRGLMVAGLPIPTGLEKQAKETPHRPRHTAVYYVPDGEEFYLLPGNAQRVAYGARVREMSLQAALRREMTWNEDDQADVRALVARLREAVEDKYTVDDRGVRRLRVAKPTRRSRRRARRNGAAVAW